MDDAEEEQMEIPDSVSVSNSLPELQFELLPGSQSIHIRGNIVNDDSMV